MKYSYLLSLFFVISLPLILAAQTVMIDNIPRDTSYTLYSAYKKIEKHHPEVAFVTGNVPKEMCELNNIVYKTVVQDSNMRRNLKLSIFKPSKGKKHPTVMMIHGGGWSSGSPDMLKMLAVHLAEKGFATITVEYRLSPEALYPVAVEDLQDAVDWIYNNEKTYCFNKNKIAVLGCSAGGQLALLIGAKNKGKRIKAVINVDGSSNFVVEETIQRGEKARLDGGKMPVDALWLGGTYSEKVQNWEEASPVYWVNSNTPPIFFICSSIPRFHNGRDEFIKKLHLFETYSEIYTFENSPHSFWLFSPWHNPTVEKIADFLKNILSK